MLRASPQVGYPLPTKVPSARTSTSPAPAQVPLSRPSSQSPWVARREEARDIKDISQGSLMQIGMELPLRSVMTLDRKHQAMGPDKLASGSVRRVMSSIDRAISIEKVKDQGSPRRVKGQATTTEKESAAAPTHGQNRPDSAAADKHLVTSGETPDRVQSGDSSQMEIFKTMLRESEERLRKSFEAQLHTIQEQNQKSLDSLSAKLDQQVGSALHDEKQMETEVSSFQHRMDVMEQRLQELSVQAETNYKTLSDKVNKTMQHKDEKDDGVGANRPTPHTSLCSGEYPSFAWGGDSLTVSNVERLMRSTSDLRSLDERAEEIRKAHGQVGLQVANPEYTAETVTTFWHTGLGSQQPGQVRGRHVSPGDRSVSPAVQTRPSSVARTPSTPAVQTRPSSVARTPSSPEPPRMSSMAMQYIRTASPQARTYFVTNAGSPGQKPGLSLQSTAATLVHSASSFTTTHSTLLSEQSKPS